MKETAFRTSDGLDLYARLYEPDNPRAALILIHGTGEHSGRYIEACEYFHDNKIAILAYDCRGAGRSPGSHMHIESWNEYRDDLGKAIAHMKRLFPRLPLFLLGVSMGGAVVLDYGLYGSVKPDGIIASSPGLGAEKISPVLQIINPLLNFLVPRTHFSLGFDLSTLSHNKDVVEAYDKDPLCSDKVTPRWGVEYIKIQKKIYSEAGGFTLPFLITIGTDDTYVPRESVDHFYEHAGSADKSRKIYPGAYHHLLYDTCADEVRSDYAQWILSRS